MDNNEQIAEAVVSAKPLFAKGWISVKDQLPDFDINVLMFHEIETINEGIFPYIEIGYVSSLTQGKDYMQAEWMDKEHNRLASPSHWMRLPKQPVGHNFK